MEKTHELFKSFDLYTEVVQQNYMRHKELIAITKAQLATKGVRDGDTLLDLGCGNAYFSKEVYPSDVQLHYKGVDLSPDAIKSAKLMLQGNTKWKTELIAEDMLQFLNNEESSVKFISSGFCLHHLATEQKKEVFTAVKERLVPGGTFFLYDVAMEDDDDKPAFNKRQLNWYNKAWHTISKEQMEAISAHILNEDFPEKVTTYTNWAKTLGFSQVNQLYRDPNKLYVCLEFVF